MHDTTLTAQRLDAMHRDGFVLLSGVLAPAGIAELREAIDWLTPIGLDYQGMLDDHYKCVFNRSPFWLQFLDLPEVIDFAGRELAPDWADAVRDAVLRHGHLHRLRIVRGPTGVVGFAIYGAYRGLRERFGPFGVDESLRGTGLGKILLHHTLTAMRAEGAHSAWFLWTDEESPAGRLYAKAGFSVTRTFSIQSAVL